MTRSAHYPFVQAILADPAADEPRLAYADWLDQHDPFRAQAIRFQIALAQDYARELTWFLLDPDQAKERSEELDKVHQPRWLAELPQFDGLEWGQARRIFRGGLVEVLTIHDLAAFRMHADEVFDRQPISGFEFPLKSTPETMRAILATPAVARLGGLDLGGHYSGAGPAYAVAQSAPLPRLRTLVIAFSTLRDDGAAHLAQARHLDSLPDLDLERNEIGAEGIESLVQGPHVRRLERLNLSWNCFGARGAKTLAATPFSRMRKLYLGMNKLGSRGLRSLLQGSWLANLETLDVSNCELNPACVHDLGAKINLPRLETLMLSGNPVGLVGAAGLARGKFPKLCHLFLGGCQLNAEAVEALAQAPWLRHLRTLWLMVNDIGNRGLRALARADLRELELLAISGIETTESAIAAFAERPPRKLRSLSITWPSERATADQRREPIPGACLLSDAMAQRFLDRTRFPHLCRLRLGRSDLAPATRAELEARFGPTAVDRGW